MRMSNGVVVVEHEPKGLAGLDAISLTIEGVCTFRFSLTDAESIGEALIETVREAEKQINVESWRGKQ